MSDSQPKKFYKLSLAERLAYLAEQTTLTPEDLAAFSPIGGLSATTADHMIENVIGTHNLPLGIAQNFIINGREVFVPMAIEEPSVIASASFMAKLARPTGGFLATTSAPEMIGQIQLLDLKDPLRSQQLILEHKDDLLSGVADLDPLLKKLGGGPRNLEVRLINDSPIGSFLVLHLIYDVRDVMGANAVNTAVEFLTPRIESLTGGRVHLRILSNLADRRLASSSVTFRTTDLAFKGYTGEKVRDGIIEAWAFAASDPYRAATHNKGIMNGVDAVVLATGNDWRAVEAGAHAYAARTGTYTSLSTWGKNENGDLTGYLEMPMAVGIVGGATRVHPTAKACLKLMGVQTASELAQIIVSVGLAQNMAALRALSTEGIQKGHMTLHARQVAIAAGAADSQIDALAAQLIKEKKIRLDRAQEILSSWSE
ncbi:MAG: hydroxymethylglutaryl-CoA reductase, degradative [Anaerolineaceae bacterium]|nr:hydroxymethylglutaryl-CoA reductase, degradative [Anaerolineaceae bacterium]